MKKNNIYKIASVLLLSAVMISSSAVVANSGTTKKNYVSMQAKAEYLNESFNAGIPGTWTQELVAQTYYWDKYYGGWDWGTGAIPPAPHTDPWNVMFEPTVGPEGAITKLVTPAMDLSAASNPTLSFWYAMGEDPSVQPAHTGQEIITVYYKTSAAGSWAPIPGAHYAEDTPEWTLASHELPNPSSTYYIAFEGEYHWGYGACLDDIVVADGGGGDIIPPVTTCTLTGEMSGSNYTSDVTVTLSATDVGSGVNFTKYKVDGGSYATYTTPFIVSGNGAHTVTYYSVDKAGNIETEKTTSFTIKYPIEITIKGGLGLSAIIKNTGTTNLTGESCHFLLNGTLIFLGKDKTKTVDIPAGGEVTVKNFVLGFGKTGIKVEAAGMEATAEGTVILFFVLGV